MSKEKLKNETEKALEADMQRYGITCIPINYFHFRGFRYTDVKDAMAQAKRQNEKRNSC